jgi:hypothetical protein
MANLAPLLAAIIPYLGGAFVAVLVVQWLRQALTPRWVLQLFESEGESSVRLVLATVVVVDTLFMQAANRLGEGMVQANYVLAGTLLGLGTAKVVGRAFANRPAAPAAQIKVEKAKVDMEGSTTVAQGLNPQE